MLKFIVYYIIHHNIHTPITKYCDVSNRGMVPGARRFHLSFSETDSLGYPHTTLL